MVQMAVCAVKGVTGCLDEPIVNMLLNTVVVLIYEQTNPETDGRQGKSRQLRN